MTIYAQSDFEDFPAGFFIDEGGDGVIEKSSSQKYRGNYSAHVNSPATEDRANAQIQAVDVTRCHMRIYIYIVSGSLQVILLEIGGGMPGVNCYFMSEGGGIYSLYNGLTNLPTAEDNVIVSGLENNRWYKVEVYYDCIAGTAAYYVDDVYGGTFPAAVSEDTTTATFGDFETLAYAGEAYYDDFLWDDEQVKDRQGFITVIKKVGPGPV